MTKTKSAIMRTPIVNEDDVEFKSSYMYSRDDLGLMLFADSQARKHHKWQLVDSASILELNRKIIHTAKYHQALFDVSEVFTVNNEHPIAQLRKPHQEFDDYYPFANAILHKFDGKLIAAGGSIYKAFQPTEGTDHNCSYQPYNYMELLQSSDVDFFFINCTEAEVNEIIREVLNILKNPRKYVKYFSAEMQIGVEIGDFDDIVYCVDRCQNVTTVYYCSAQVNDDPNDLNYLAETDWTDGGGKFQFIHRIYPSPASVIGAFDLGPCMGFYDGHDFYATPLGAWSIATQTIILDVSRRSTSFEYRISKYITNHRCRLVIVNGSNPEVYQRLAEDPKLHDKEKRVFYPVKGLKSWSQHVKMEDFDGLDERIAIRKAMGKGWSDDMMPKAPKMEKDKKNKLNRAVYDREYHEYEKKMKELEKNQDYIDHTLIGDREYAREQQKRRKDLFRVNFNAESSNSDYAGGNFHDYSIEYSNGIFAAQGKVDCITWRSNQLEEIFDKPQIKHRLHPDFNKDEAPTVMYLDAMKRWFTAEQIKALKTGPITPPQCVPINQSLFDIYADEIRLEVIKNIMLAEAKAKEGITILTENPGRQWTASINPVVGEVRDYYHPYLLEKRGPLLIGIPPAVYCLLRLAQMKSDSVWKWLPRDVLKLIMHALAAMLVENGNRLLLDTRIQKDK